MPRVDPGELKYPIIIKNKVRSLDSNQHYIVMPELIQARAGVMKYAGGDRVERGAARSVDTVTFIVRWGVRQKIQRDATITFQNRIYEVDWMDSTPWAEVYARVRGISTDEGKR